MPNGFPVFHGEDLLNHNEFFSILILPELMIEFVPQFSELSTFEFLPSVYLFELKECPLEVVEDVLVQLLDLLLIRGLESD